MFSKETPLGPVLYSLAIHPVIKEARQVTETSHPGGIDLCSFFLDDGLSAGFAPAVRRFLSAVITGFRKIDLEVNLDKAEIIPACTTSQSLDSADFQGCSWNGSANFKLLGAAVGTTEWCEDILGRRVAKTRALLTAIGKVPDAQAPFCLLRSCSGWAKVLYS